MVMTISDHDSNNINNFIFNITKNKLFIHLISVTFIEAKNWTDASLGTGEPSV